MHKHIALILAQIWLLLGFALSAAAQTSSEALEPDTSLFNYICRTHNPIDNAYYYLLEEDIVMKEFSGEGDFNDPMVRMRFIRSKQMLGADTVRNPYVARAHFRFERRRDELKGSSKFNINYVFPLKDQRFLALALFSDENRNFSKEAALMTPVINNAVPEWCQLLGRDKYFYFVGRRNYLERPSYVAGPNNVSCYSDGQMNWFTLRSQEKAERINKEQLDMVLNRKSRIKTSAVDTVNVSFEGQRVRAVRCVFSARVLSLGRLMERMEGRGKLIVYYVVAPVRGRWVSCVMSYYESQATNGQLPWLLQQVLTLQD